MKCQFTDHLQLAYSVCVMIVFPGFIKDRRCGCSLAVDQRAVIPCLFLQVGYAKKRPCRSPRAGCYERSDDGFESVHLTTQWEMRDF